MIHAYLDHMDAPASDDEDDRRPDVRFVLKTAAEDAKSAGSPAAADVAFAPPGRGASPAACAAIVVCGPGAASAFAASAFDGLRAVPWTLEVVGGVAPRQLPRPPASPRFLTTAADEASSVALVLMVEPVPGELASAWVEALLNAFSAATQVVFLDRLFRAEYRSDERPQEPHLTGLYTAAWAAAANAEKKECVSSAVATLPGPNFVEGAAAALLTACEGEQRQCLVAYTLQDGAHVSSMCLEAFEGLRPLFRSLGLKDGEGRASSVDYLRVLEKVVSPPSMSVYA